MGTLTNALYVSKWHAHSIFVPVPGGVRRGFLVKWKVRNFGVLALSVVVMVRIVVAVVMRCVVMVRSVVAVVMRSVVMVRSVVAVVMRSVVWL
jgi:hypothetical protein